MPDTSLSPVRHSLTYKSSPMRWLTGHTKPVRAVAYLPDGRIVSGGEDRTVRVWDASGGGTVLLFRATGVVYAVAAAPDGQEIAFAGRTGRESETGLRVEAAHPHTGASRASYPWRIHTGHPSVWSVSYSPDGELLVAVSRVLGGGNFLNGHTAQWWERAERRATAGIPVYRSYAARFDSNGRLAVTHQQAVSVLDHLSKEAKFTAPLPVDWAADVAFVGDGLVVAANSFLYPINVPADGRRKRIKTGILGITALVASPDGTQLLAAGRPGVVERYDTATLRPIVRYDFDTGKIHAAAFSPDGLTFALATDNGILVCDAT